MTTFDYTEKRFEQDIEEFLTTRGGYIKGNPKAFNRELALDVDTFVSFIKTSQPKAIMTAYNAINGQRSSESRELLTDILRGEWGYDGLVMTDWWNHGDHHKEVLAGNDVKMAQGFPARLLAAQEAGLLTRGDLEKCARRVLAFIMKLE